MKKQLFLLLLSLLFISCSTSQSEELSSIQEETSIFEEVSAQEEEPFIPEGAQPIDETKLIWHNKLIKGMPDYYTNAFEFNHAQNSYEVVGCLEYDGEYYREYQTFLPNFTPEEIPYKGFEKISNFFKEQQEQEENYKKDFCRFEDNYIIDSAMFKHHYSFSDYSVFYTENFLSVVHLNGGYYGGAHGLESFISNVFDMTTGDQLTIYDIIENTPEQIDLLAQVIHDYAEKEDISALVPESMDDIKFYLDKNGIMFLFSSYEISSYSSGLIQIYIPYENFSDTLKINIDT